VWEDDHVKNIRSGLLVWRLSFFSSIQVRKNDPIPNYDLTVFDIDRHKVSLKTSTGEIVYIPFIL